MVFRFGSCKIILQFSFLLMLAFALLSDTSQLLNVLLFASLHELGHLAILLIFGGRPDSITLAFYGVGLKHTAPLKRWEELLFLLGGIVVNAIFALCNIEREINAALFAINALPLYPLDMGRALALYLPYRVCRGISVVFLILLLTAALFFKNISLLFIAFYIIIFSVKEELR